MKKRSDGRYEGRYIHKGKQKVIYAKSEKEVKEKLKKIKAEIQLGTYEEHTKITVNKWFEKWLQDYKKNYVKPLTYDGYERIISTHIIPHIGNIKLSNLSADDIQDIFNKMIKNKYSSRMLQYVHVLLKASITQAVNNRLIKYNVMDAVKCPRLNKNKLVNVLSLSEQKTLLKHARNERVYPAILLMLFTGIRRGETLSLKWSDINFASQIMCISKSLNRVRNFDTGKSEIIINSAKTESSIRYIPLLQEVLKELELLKTRQKFEKRTAQGKYVDDNFIFCDSFGKPYEPRKFQKYFQKICKSAEITTNIHALRHTFATRGLEQGIESKVMQELLGHSSISTTLNIYTHVLSPKKFEAINKLKGII